MRFVLLLAWVWTVVVAGGAAEVAGAEVERERSVLTVRPTEDSLAVLHNPDMGWVLYENYPLDQDPLGSSTLLTCADEDFADVGAVALMFSWQDIERAEGEYDFSKVNFAYDYWKQRGKEIQLRLSTESLLWWTSRTPPAGTGVPEHVLAKIPEEHKQHRTSSGLPYTLVDARDEHYGQQMAKFLAAVAQNFSGERPVTLVDLRGYGLWGEWHTGYQYATLEDRRAGLKRIIDIYADAFPEHHLSLSYSYDPDSPAELRSGPTLYDDPSFTEHYQQFLEYSAFDHALTKRNVTLRRDGAGGAVHPNERRLCEEAFRSVIRGPMMSEFLGGYSESKRGGRDHVNEKVNDALSLHPNYVCLLGWQGGDALQFTQERPDLIEHGLRTMGYRLVPIEVEYPRVITPGHEFALAMTWVNRGGGRAMQDFELELQLADAHGKVVASSRCGALPTSRWIKDLQYEVRVNAAFGELSDGKYELRMALIDPRDGRKIAMPLVGAVGDGSYRLGGCTVAAE